MTLKTSIIATEITEDTEMKRGPQIFHAHLTAEVAINGNQLFFSVNSVFSVASFL
jgi:hypothetical protein